jgi:hypothetical protein
MKAESRLLDFRHFTQTFSLLVLREMGHENFYPFHNGLHDAGCLLAGAYCAVDTGAD